MMTEIDHLNRASYQEAREKFLVCCGSRAWAQRMTDARPFKKLAGLLKQAEQIWWSLEEGDWLEAFASHPKIGERTTAAHQSPKSSQWASQEQAGTSTATHETMSALTEANYAYEKKFGYIFIVCATGKSAEAMLALCHKRLGNDPSIELRIAAEEQQKITEIRLRKLLGVLE